MAPTMCVHLDGVMRHVRMAAGDILMRAFTDDPWDSLIFSHSPDCRQDVRGVGQNNERR